MTDHKQSEDAKKILATESSRCGVSDHESVVECVGGFAFSTTSAGEKTPTQLEQCFKEGDYVCPSTLAPHKYPIWIWLIALGILTALVVSLVQLPPFFRAAALVQRAETLAEHGQNDRAIELFTNALAIAPRSKRAQIGLAIGWFRRSDKGDQDRAIAVLRGLTLSTSDWEKIDAVMPLGYHRFFPDAR
jgi:hypothetical protein